MTRCTNWKSLGSLALLALTVAMASTANATDRKNALPTVGNEKFRRATPKAWARYIPGQKPVWHAWKGTDNAKNDPVYEKAYDSVAWDTAADAPLTSVYGPTPRSVRVNYTDAGSTYFANIPFYVDDMKTTAASKGKPSSKQMLMFRWNPLGLDGTAYNDGASTGVDCIVLIGSAAEVVKDPAGPGAWSGSLANYLYDLGGTDPVLTPGVLVNFGDGEGGWYAPIASSDFSSPLYVPLPYTDNGGFIYAIGQVTADGFFDTFSDTDAPNAAAHAYLASNCSPTDPYQPGTNPTDSDKFAWTDGLVRGNYFGGTNDSIYIGSSEFVMANLTNTADFDQPYSEYTDLDWGAAILATPTRLHPAIGFAIDTNEAYLTINTTIAGLDQTNRPDTVLYDIVVTDASGTPLDDGSGVVYDTQFAAMKNNSEPGQFIAINEHLPDNVNLGEARYYVVTTKPFRCTRGTTSVWDTNGGSATKSMTIYAGDADDDNSITVFDYGILSDYFDKSESDADWFTIGDNGAAPVQADFDDDGAVTVFDYGILSDNFDKSGDEDPLA